MRITVLAFGRVKRSPEQTMVDDYAKRAKALARRLGISDLVVDALEDKGPPEGRRAREAQALLARVPEGAALIVLDERGDNVTSQEWALDLNARLGSGAREIVYVIGGADGLAQEITARAARRLALGRQTWPHMLVRVMLLEQIYRALTILTNHPYHRA